MVIAEGRERSQGCHSLFARRESAPVDAHPVAMSGSQSITTRLERISLGNVVACTRTPVRSFAPSPSWRPERVTFAPRRTGVCASCSLAEPVPGDIRPSKRRATGVGGTDTSIGGVEAPRRYDKARPLPRPLRPVAWGRESDAHQRLSARRAQLESDTRAASRSSGARAGRRCAAGPFSSLSWCFSDRLCARSIRRARPNLSDLGTESVTLTSELVVPTHHRAKRVGASGKAPFSGCAG